MLSVYICIGLGLSQCKHNISHTGSFTLPETNTNTYPETDTDKMRNLHRSQYMSTEALLSIIIKPNSIGIGFCLGLGQCKHTI